MKIPKEVDEIANETYTPVIIDGREYDLLLGVGKGKICFLVNDESYEISSNDLSALSALVSKIETSKMIDQAFTLLKVVKSRISSKEFDTVVKNIKDIDECPF